MKSAQVQKKWNEVQKSVVRTILCPFDLVSIPLEIGELNSIPLVRGPITETEWAAAVFSWECSKTCQKITVRLQFCNSIGWRMSWGCWDAGISGLHEDDSPQQFGLETLSWQLSRWGQWPVQAPWRFLWQLATQFVLLGPYIEGFKSYPNQKKYFFWAEQLKPPFFLGPKWMVLSSWCMPGSGEVASYWKRKNMKQSYEMEGDERIAE